MTGEIRITSLQSGVPQGTDVTPAVDTIDTTMASTGTTKKYLRSDELTWLLDRFGYTTLNPVNVATTVNLLANYNNGASGVGATLTAEMTGILTVDGIDLLSIPTTMVLVKDQDDSSQNGIYLVTNSGSVTTNWVLTRSPEFNQTSNILNKMPVFVNYGTVNADTLWISNVVTPVTVGTDAILFILFMSVSAVITLPLLMSQGGTSASLSPVNNSVIYSTGSAMALLPPVASRVMVTDGSGNIGWSLTLPSGTVITGYLPLTGGTMSGAINMGSNFIHSLLDPVSLQDAATKNYVDTVAAAFAVTFVAKVASTGNFIVTYNNGASGVGATLTNASVTTPLSIDGVTLAVNDTVLIKDQSSTFQNGYYTVTNIGSGITNWVLTRSVIYDQPVEIQPGDLFVIVAGTANAKTTWIQTATVTTIGTDAITFVQYTVAVPVPVAQGGTGATTAAGARTNLGAAASGANADITSLTGLTGVLEAPTGISSSTGASLLDFQYTASAVNFFTIVNNITGQSPGFFAAGADADISIQLLPKGNAAVEIYDPSGVNPAILNLFSAGNAGINQIQPQVTSTNTRVAYLPDYNGTIVLDSTITPLWTDFSGTIGFTGLVASPTLDYARWKQMGKTVYVAIAVSGTSNATTFTITSLPAAASSTYVSAGYWIPLCLVNNNGLNSFAVGQLVANGTTMTLYLASSFTSISASGWTSTGGKGFFGEFFYETN